MAAGMSSPAVGMLGLGAFVTRTGMTPAGMGADMGGMAEGIGGNLTVTSRDQEEERRGRIETIVNMIAGRWGWVSQEGVKRCAQRVGFECLWEEGLEGKRTLSIAGQGVLIDVEFTGEDVHDVGLSFPNSGLETGRAAPEGAEVLKKDLQGNGQAYVMVDQFVKNLERLATMDRLGVGGLSCFDAVDGIGGCLKSVFGWELQKIQKERGALDDGLDVETTVMCTGSGRPKMHSRGRMGLSLQYWMERRLVQGRKRTAMEMEVDDPSPQPRRKREPVVYSALIDCEACSSDLYPPIRVSSAWVSDAVGKPANDLNPLSVFPNDSPIDWQEPLPTLISSDTDTGADAHASMDQMSIDGRALLSAGKSPNVRFVARLDPPVVVPLQVAIAIYDSVGAPIAQESINPTTYEALLFPSTTASTTTLPSSNLAPQPTQSQKPLTAEQTITTYNATGSPSPSKHKHKYTLFHPTQSFAYQIDNIPFSHPRQIIAILPFLRQWARLGSILRRSFSVTPASPTNRKKKQPNEAQQEEEEARIDLALRQASTLEEELAAFLAPTDTSTTTTTASPPPLPIDISLSLTPAPPRLTIVFEIKGQLRSLILGVSGNGEVVVMREGGGWVGGGGGGGGGGAPAAAADGDGAPGTEEGGYTEEEEEKDIIKHIKKVLEISESIGVLVAWLREREREREMRGRGK